jgi:16S rRNA (guanine527-N7)-methyltransferase
MSDCGKAIFLRSVTVSRETLARLERYAALLEQWQPKINLVGPKTMAEYWVRHFLDSAQLQPYLGTPKRIVDLGSGAGFPGLVLAILTGIETHLVDSDQRKCIFLREVSRETSAPVTVHNGRAEALAPLGADLITARAFAPLAEILAMGFAHLAPGGRMLLLKGEGWAAEVEAARAAGWAFHVKHFPSLTSSESAILALTDIARA